MVVPRDETATFRARVIQRQTGDGGVTIELFVEGAKEPFARLEGGHADTWALGSTAGELLGIRLSNIAIRVRGAIPQPAPPTKRKTKSKAKKKTARKVTTKAKGTRR